MNLKEIGSRTKSFPGLRFEALNFFQIFSNTEFCEVTCPQVDSRYLLTWLDPIKKTAIVSASATAERSYLLAMYDISAKSTAFYQGVKPQIKQSRTLQQFK